MKTISGTLLLALLLTFACNESKRGNDSDMAYDNDDSREQAEEKNKEKFDDNDMRKDAEWVADVVEANYDEIAMATLAAQRSENTEVKRIGKMLAEHHSKTLSELKSLAQNKSISTPMEPSEEVNRDAERFSDEAGKEFDQRWCEEMIDMHDESISDFEKRLEQTDDPEIKAFINKTLPILRGHRDELKACEDRLERSAG